SGASAYQTRGLSPISATAWPTVPCGALRSIGITPSLRISGASGQRNSCALPSTRISRPSASLAAKPQMPSQLDECGAAISTSFGRSGNCPTTRQPPSRSTLRPIQRARRLALTRGAAGGSGGTIAAVPLMPLRAPCGAAPSIPVPASTRALDRTALALVAEAALLRCACGPCRHPRHRCTQSALDEGRQPLARILAVAVLGAEALRLQHQHAIVGDAAVALGQQPFAHRFGQRRRARHVEAQLHRGGDLVDVLTARAAGADEAFDEFVFRNLDVHADASRPARARRIRGSHQTGTPQMSHRILLAVLLAVLAAFPAHAQQAPADDARIDRLLEVTRARAMLDAMLPQIEASQRQMVAQ